MFPRILDTLLMPQLDPGTKTFFGMSSILRRALETTDEKVNDKVNTFLQKPLFRMSDLDKKYRIINYLEKTNLINDRRDNKGTGWRNLGFAEYIYISILLELRKYGLKSDQLEHFKRLYEEYSVYVIFAVLAGHEITMIFKTDGFCAFLDPTFLGIYEEEDEYFKNITPSRGAGEIQLKLSYFVSNALSLISKPAPSIEYSLAKSKSESDQLSYLKKYEQRILQAVSDLPVGKDLNIRQLEDDSILLKIKEDISVDSELADKLSALVDGDYFDLIGKVRERKVVHLVKEKAKKITKS